jgi:predicted nucleotidyltransferase
MVKKVNTKDAIVQRILKARERLALLGVRSIGLIGLFGSFVRGEQTSLSDVDMLVEFMPEKHTFDNFMEVAFLLEELLGRKVEVVTPEALSPYIGPHILREVERVPIAA